MTVSGSELRRVGREVFPDSQPEDYQPNSVDVHINPNQIYVFSGACLFTHSTTLQQSLWNKMCPYQSDDRLIITLYPGKLYLMSSLEYVKIPDDMCGFLHGVSTMARMGFSCHEQAGLLDSGWEGNVTGEVTVTVPLELTLSWNTNSEFERPRLGQIVLMFTSEKIAPEYLYRGRYQGDLGAVFAKPRYDPE